MSELEVFRNHILPQGWGKLRRQRSDSQKRLDNDENLKRIADDNKYIGREEKSCREKREVSSCGDSEETGPSSGQGKLR